MSEEIQRINLDDYIQTGEGGTALTYTKKDGLSLAKLYRPGFEADRAKAEFLTALLWTMCHNMPGDRVQHIFHITHEQMMAHWDIFFPVYLGTSDPQAIDEATKRLLPYYAAKVPYMFDMVFSAPMPDAALQNIVKLF